jgi:energy-coupling factor transporter ATP-binding protein EcfA2
VNLGSLLDRLHDRPVLAEVAPVEETLVSPCLLGGDNGQGKSLVAKALASAIPCRGEASLQGPGGPLRARLLFQDVLNQTLMRSMPQLTRRGSGNGLAAAYDAVVAGIRQRAPETGDALRSFADRRCDPVPLSLLEIKVLLAAARIADQGALLILDEPDWGLSRCDALAFVGAVVSAAHQRSVPVMLISHKPWWQKRVGSMRWVSKETASSSSAKGCLFRIRIRSAPGGGS